MGNAWISLERGNSKDPPRGLGTNRDGNLRDWDGWKWKVLNEMTGRGKAFQGQVEA